MRYILRVESDNVVIEFDSLSGLHVTPGDLSKGDEVGFIGMTNLDDKIIRAMQIVVTIKNTQLYGKEAVSFLENTIQGVKIHCKRFDVTGMAHYRCQQWT